MKKILVMAFAMMLVVWVAGVQNAAAAFMDPVTFYVVDDNTGSDDDSVTLSFDYTNWTPGVALQLSTDNSSWTTVGGSYAVGANDWQQVWLRVDLGSGFYDTDGNVEFSGLEVNSGLYNAVQVVWDQYSVSGGPTFDISINTIVANDDDNVGAVPIPPSAFMLFSGILGLFGVRRMRRDG